MSDFDLNASLPDPSGGITNTSQSSSPGISIAAPKSFAPPPSQPSFDIAAKLPSFEQPEDKGITANAAAGFNEAGTGLLGFPVDATTAAINAGTAGINYLLGTKIPKIQHPFGGSETFQSLEHLYGGSPQDVAAVTPTEQLVRSIARGATSVAMPGLAAKAIPELAGGAEAVRQAMTAGLKPSGLIAGGAGAATGDIAASEVPEPYKGIAEIAGNLIGGGLAAGTVGSAADATLARGIQKLQQFASPKSQLLSDTAGNPYLDLEGNPISQEDAIKAGQRIASASRQPAQNLLLNNEESPIEGFQPTLGQSSGNLGVLGLERMLRNKYNDLFTAHDAANNAALSHAVGDLAPEEAASTAGRFVRTQLDALNAADLAEQTQLGDAAKQATDQLSGAPTTNTATDLGADSRQQLEQIRVPLKNAASRALEGVDPEGTLALPTDTLSSVAKGLLGDPEGTETPFAINSRAGENPAAAERPVLDAAAKMSDVTSFGDLRGLLGQVSAAQRAIRSDPALGAESRPYARMSQLRSAIEDTMVNGAERSAEMNAQSASTVSRLTPEQMAAKRDAYIQQLEESENRLREAGDVANADHIRSRRLELTLQKEPLPEGWQFEPDHESNGYVIRDQNGDIVSRNDDPFAAISEARQSPSYTAQWEQQLITARNAWYGSRENATEATGVGTSAGGNGGARQASVSGPSGTAGETAQRPGGTQGVSPVSEAAQPLTPNFDVDAADRLQTANRAYADYKQRFRQGPVGDILASGNTPSGYRLGDAQVVSRLFRKGPQGGDAIDSLIRAAGSPEEAARVLGDYPAYSLRLAAEKNGIIDPAAYNRWAAQYKEALDKLPDLRDRFGSAAKASQELADSAARWQQAREDFQDTAFKHYLKVDPDVAPEMAIDRLMRSQNPVAEARSLMQQAWTHPDVVQSAQRNTVDWLLGKIRTNTEAGTTGEAALSKAALQRILSNPAQADAVKTILGPERFDILQRTSDAMDLAARAHQATAIKGSPATAADLHALGAQKTPSLLFQLLRGEVMGEAAGHVASAVSGVAGIPTAMRIAGGIWGVLRNQARQQGLERIDQIAALGVLHPELGRVLLGAAAKSASDPRLAIIGRQLGILGLTGALQSSDQKKAAGYADGGRMLDTEHKIRHASAEEQGAHLADFAMRIKAKLAKMDQKAHGLANGGSVISNRPVAA